MISIDYDTANKLLRTEIVRKNHGVVSVTCILLVLFRESTVISTPTLWTVPSSGTLDFHTLGQHIGQVSDMLSSYKTADGWQQ